MLALALGLGALVRLYHLGGLSFDGDELFAVLPQAWSARSALGVVLATGFDDQHPPLYYLAALAWNSLAGTSEAAVRLPSAVCGLATLPVVYLLGAALRSRRVGARAALILAVMPFHVYYSRAARMYALLTLLATLSTWLLVRLGRGGREDAPAGMLWAYVTAAAAMTLTHYFGAFVVVAHALAVALRGRRSAPGAGAWLAVFGALASVFAPFAVFAAWQARHRDHSYFHFDLPVYRGLLCWLGASHPRLPVACALPVVLLGVLGAVPVAPGRRPGALPGPPPPSRWERWGLRAVAAGGAAAAAVAVARAGAVAARVAAFRIGVGEQPAAARLQGGCAALAVAVGAAGVAVAALLLAERAALAGGTRPRSGAETPAHHASGEARDPLDSLPELTVLVLGVPLAITVVAGVLGMPLVLARNFLPAAPLVALMVAGGLDALPGRVRGTAGALLVAGCLAVAGRFGAVPALGGPRLRVRDWLEDVYSDWRGLRAIVPADGAPVVTVQSFATDAVMHYEADHDVVRLVPGEGAAPAVGQLQRASGTWAGGLRVGEALRAPPGAAFWWVDPRAASEHLAAVRAPVAAGIAARFDCARAGVVPEDAVVSRCVAR